MFIFSVYPMLAHAGSEYGNTIEMWVSGIGIVLMIAVTIYQIGWKQREVDFSDDEDVELFIDES